MRWFKRTYKVRIAKIDNGLRETFDQHGVATKQSNLASGHCIFHNNRDVMSEEILRDLLLWPTEKYGRDVGKETRSLRGKSNFAN
jgi:hypothetical protein